MLLSDPFQKLAHLDYYGHHLQICEILNTHEHSASSINVARRVWFTPTFLLCMAIIFISRIRVQRRIYVHV